MWKTAYIYILYDVFSSFLKKYTMIFSLFIKFFVPLPQI